MDSQEEDEQFDMEYNENAQQIDDFEAKLNNKPQNLSSDEDNYQVYQKRDILPQIQYSYNLNRPQSKIEAIQRQLEFHKKQPPKNLQEECEEIINSKNESLKDKKIRELVQRNRTLFVKYEKEKAGRQKLEEQLNKALKDADENIKILDKSIPKSNSQSQKDPLVRALKGPEKEEVPEDLKGKFKEADKKVQEQRIKIQQLKSELNKAMRVIQREVGGENISLDQLLLDENSWKARAQQIEILKGKVRDLTGKLGNSSQYSEMSVQSKSKENSKQNQQLELFKQQLDQQKQENELLQSKIKAVSSRRQILEDQIKDIKLEYEKNKRILLDKSENDDRYIQALKNELEKIKRATPPQETKIVYKPTDDDESKKLRSELKYCKDQLQRNEQIIKELVADVNFILIQKVNKQSQQPMIVTKKDDDKTIKLEQEIKALRKERDDFFKTLTKDQDTQKMLKDLTLQNVKLRNKIDDLTKK